MSKCIVNFGDSWAHGADAGVRHNYSKVLADQLGYECQDYSKPSTSIHNMILQLQTFFKQSWQPQSEYTALFFVTAVERIELFDQSNQPYTIWSQEHPDFYSKWYSERLGEFTANTSLITLQTMCRARKNIKDVYILGWQNPVLWPEVDRSCFIDEGKSCMAQQFGGQGVNPLYDLIDQRNCPYLILDNWHPSIAGHQFIAEVILQHLKLDR
jgi:hypothetical protein